MAIILRSYIFDLDHVSLYLGIFFILSCIMENYLHKNTHLKATKLLLRLILAAGMSYIKKFVV